MRGFRRLASYGSETDTLLRTALLCTEHHGALAERRLLGPFDEGHRSLFARIVGLADAFDRKTAGSGDLEEAARRAAAELRWEGDAEDTPLIGFLQRLPAAVSGPLAS